MRYRRLGGTDIVVSEIGFGCGNTAGLMACGDRRVQERTVRYALGRGINFFDTATTYGDSEENLGRVFAGLFERPVVATKVDLTTADLDGSGPVDIAGAVRRSVDGSLRRLGFDRIDLVHLHNRVTVRRTGAEPTTRNPHVTVDEVLGKGGVQDAFRSLQQEGKIRYFGFCASGGDPAAHQRLLDDGAFQSALVYYNVLNPSAGRAMPARFAGPDYANVLTKARGRGLGTVVLRVLDGGALSGDPDPHPLNGGTIGSDPGYQVVAVRARGLEFLKRRTDETLAQVAIRFALQSTHVSTVLIGFSDTAQIDEAVACSGRAGFSDEQLALLEEWYAAGAGVT
jgi:aryl-alcohol dehydrogenase-like predicted oxidoreductase